MRAKSSTLVTVIPIAEKTGRCEIRPDSYVRKIETDAQGRATGAIYFDAKRRREVFQRAKAVFVCANGAETPEVVADVEIEAVSAGPGELERLGWQVSDVG